MVVLYLYLSECVHLYLQLFAVNCVFWFPVCLTSQSTRASTSSELLFHLYFVCSIRIFQVYIYLLISHHQGSSVIMHVIETGLVITIKSLL